MIINKPARPTLLGKMYQVTTYEEALEDVYVQGWKRVMDLEIEYMGLNLVWYLVQAPRGINPLEAS